MGEGNIAIANCDVQIDVIGSTCDIGGILGNLHYGNKMTNCTYSGSLKLTDPTEEKDRGEIGGLVGTVLTDKAHTTSISGSTANVKSAEVTTMDGTIEDVTDTITATGAFYSGMAESQKGAYAFEATVNDRHESSTNIAAKIGDKTYLTIADAVAAAKNGEVIDVMPGTFEEPLTLPLKSLTLRGNGDVLLKGGIQFAAGAVPEGTEITIEGLNFEGKGIKLVGWGATKPLGNTKTLTIKNNKFSNVQGEKNIYAIHINNSDDAIAGLSIIDNEFYDNETGAIYATARGTVVITGNKIVNSGMNGATLAFIDKAGQAANSVTITNNQFIEWGLNENDAGVREGRALRLSDFAEGSNINITKNVFSCTDAPEQHLKATGIQDGSTVNFNENYWGMENPDFGSLLETEGKVNVTSYYQMLAEDGTLKDLVVIPDDMTNVAKKLELEAVKDSNRVNVYITGEDETGAKAVVENLVAVDLALEVTGGKFGVIDVDVPAELQGKWDVSVVGENRYLIKEIGVSEEDMENPGDNIGDANHDLNGGRIHIATVTLGGYGSGKLQAAGGDGVNDVAQRAKSNNIVLSSHLAETAVDFDIKPATQKLTINVAFPNAVSENVAAYQAMKATVSGGDLSENIVFEFGEDCVPQKDGGYSFTQDLTQNVSYTVTLEGAGYRTVRYSVNMNGDKTLNFWNNVMDEATVIEKGNDKSKAKVTYLAGDIVKDNDINIYDLSAVVSYFGTDNDVAKKSDYAKYDLNRDGKIDSKDVAMVLVSWGN